MERYIKNHSIWKVLKENLVISDEEIQKLLSEMPSEDVAPVMHGKWIDYDYCPVCGSKMDLEE